MLYTTRKEGLWQIKVELNIFRKRRENKKTFGALIDKDKVEKLESILQQRNQSKKEWLESKIDEEISK